MHVYVLNQRINIFNQEITILYLSKKKKKIRILLNTLILHVKNVILSLRDYALSTTQQNVYNTRDIITQIFNEKVCIENNFH